MKRFVELDLLGWQLLWVGGLFAGQRILGNASLVPRHGFLWAILFLCAMAFLVWRWTPISPGTISITRMWLFDKWHLGPLRLLNFAITASVTATFLKSLNQWEALLRPLSLIGRHMLAVFSMEICLSVLLIGRTESGLAGEPIISALVICQLISAPCSPGFWNGVWPPRNLLAASGPARPHFQCEARNGGRIASVEQKLHKTHSSQDRSLSFAEALVYSSWEARAWKNE